VHDVHEIFINVTKSSSDHECGADCPCAEVEREPDCVSSGENGETEDEDDNGIDLKD